MAGKYRVVHNGKAGGVYTIIGDVVLSPDGKRVAYGAQKADTWCIVVDGSEVQDVAELGTPVFSPDSRHIAYSARIGDKWQLFVNNAKETKNRTQITRYQFNSDSSRIVYVDGGNDKIKPRLVVSDLNFSKQYIIESSGALMEVSEDKTGIAAVREKGNRHLLIEFSFMKPDVVKEGPSYESIIQISMNSNGNSVAYIAEKGGKRILVMNNKEELYPEGTQVGPVVFRPDTKGVSFIMVSNERPYVHQAFYRQEMIDNNYDEIADLEYSSDSLYMSFSAKKEIKGKSGRGIFAVVNGKEGPRFDMVVSPVFSPDGKKLIYRARQDGKRFIVEADINGKVIRRHPAYEQVFQPVFTADGKSVAYGVKDGNKLIWKVEKF